MKGLAVASLAAALLLSGCAATTDAPVPSAHPVTSDEAQLLAITRFTNFDTGSRPLRTEIVENGTTLAIDGWYDYTTNTGYAAVTGDFDPQAMLWTTTDVGIVSQDPDTGGHPVLPIPDLTLEQWQSHALDASTSTLDALLLAIGSLGSDRPDNPVLLQQSGTLWLREDEIDGTPVTVFAAPPSDEPRTASDPPLDADTSGVRLWVDAEGLLRRAELRLGDDWVTVDFADEDAPALALPEQDDGGGG